MNYLTKRAYTIFDGEKVVAVIPNKHLPKNSKYRAMNIVACKSVMYGIDDLNETAKTNDFRLNLSVTAIPFENLCGALSVEYRLDGTKKANSSWKFDYLNLRCSSTGCLLSVLESKIKCKVKIYEITVYALLDIPLDEVRNIEKFLRMLEDKSYRSKYKIACIAENIDLQTAIPVHGIVFIDFDLFKQLIQ